MDETSLLTIESKARVFAAAYSDLAAIVNELNEAVDAVKRARLSAIKRAALRSAEHRQELAALIDGAHHLFVKPRTYVFHGIKLGLQKGKGGIEFDDAAKVIALIRKHFDADQAAHLIHTKESPNKEAIEQLPVADLKRIGCEVKDAADQVVIKPAGTDVDKIVAYLLKGEEKEAA